MIQILWLLLIVGLVAVAFAFSEWIPYIAVGGSALLLLGWVLISTLSPAKPDRTCPKCGEEGLVKIERGVPGVRCEKCDFRDDSMHVAYLDEW